MQKDFTFPFYYKEWLVSTQGMPADIRGWYVNLLCHQADKGSLPNEMEDLAELAGVKISEYQRFVDGFNQWLNPKFNQNDNGGLENAKMKAVLAVRQEYLQNQSRKATVAVFVRRKRKEHNFENDVWKTVSAELMKVEVSYLTKKETYKKYEVWWNQWFNQRLNPSIEDENDNNNIYIDNNKGGVGEKQPMNEPWHLDVLKKEVKNSMTWKEQVVRSVSQNHQGFDMASLDTYLDEFDVYLKNTGDEVKTLKDYKKHFFNWLDKNLTPRNRRKKNNTESSTLKKLQSL
tara:strand:- start:1539 stop:2402 length:864 start_codon:yes stop_codon:yes gene_type:complete